ncbi:MAG: hypothetical protein QJR00_00840 [Bacillota bacterium]|nr:hypothetical protein [Bacillota bacterium]
MDILMNKEAMTRLQEELRQAPGKVVRLLKEDRGEWTFAIDQAKPQDYRGFVGPVPVAVEPSAIGEEEEEGQLLFLWTSGGFTLGMRMAHDACVVDMEIRE